MKVEEYLIKKGYDYELKSRPSGDNFIMICPFCNGGNEHEKSFAINAESGLWNCKRENHCGKSGTFFKLQKLLGDEPENLDKYVKKNTNKKYTIKKVIQIPLSEDSIRYLIEERKFTKEIINKFKLFDGIKNDICFPYYKNGIIVNVKSRLKHIKKFSQWHNPEPTLFNIDNIIENDILIITEGEMDCIALTQYGLQNVVSGPYGANGLTWIEHEWDFLEKFKKIILILDTDKAGEKGMNNIVSRLGLWRCKIVKLPYKDANECLIKQVSNEEIFYHFKAAKEFVPVEIKSAGNYCNEVLDIYRNPKQYMGDATGFPELDKVLHGFRKGEVTLWTGQNNSGKSTILNQVCLYQASKDKKCCIASLEMKPSRYLKWAIEQALGKDNPTEEEIIKTFEWIDEHIYVLDIQDNVFDTKILELFEFTARKYGINHFVIDSLMKIRFKDEDDMMGQVKFLNNYIDFCKKFNAHGHLVAHPRKQESDKDKPDKTDVKGRGELTDLVDNVIIIWRNIEDKDDFEDEYQTDGLLIVRKNREFGYLANIPLTFDPYSRRFLCKGQFSFFD